MPSSLSRISWLVTAKIPTKRPDASPEKQEDACIRALMWITGPNYNQIQELSQCSKVFGSVLFSQYFYPIKLCSYDDKTRMSSQNHMTPFPSETQTSFPRTYTAKWPFSVWIRRHYWMLCFEHILVGFPLGSNSVSSVCTFFPVQNL